MSFPQNIIIQCVYCGDMTYTLKATSLNLAVGLILISGLHLLLTHQKSLLCNIFVTPKLKMMLSILVSTLPNIVL